MKSLKSLAVGIIAYFHIFTFAHFAAHAETVPPPWTPVEAKNGVVSVWGREYAFASNALPVGLKSAGHDLLAGPMRIVCTDADGKELVWKKGGSWVQESDDESATVCAWQEADAVVADVTMRIEFDGMAKVSLALVPGAKGEGVEISRVWLEIPLSHERASLFSWYPVLDGPDDTGLENSGEIAGNLAWPFLSSVWIGDESAGLAWFCESDENFHPGDPNRVVEVLPGSKETVLRIRLSDKPIAKPDTWMFGLQATPVKPLPRKFNANHTVHAPQMGAGILFKRPEVWWTAQRAFPDGKIDETLDAAARSGAKTVVFHEDWIPVQNNPTLNPDFKKIVDACHARGMKALVYLGYELSSLDPAWGENHAKWLVMGDDGKIVGGVAGGWFRQPGQRDYSVCYHSDAASLWLERAKKAYDSLVLDGFYLDGTILLRKCANERHGCGWRDGEGKLHVTYPIFAVRRMMRELYSFVESRGGRIDAHQSGCVCPATLAFVHSYWDGEQIAFRKDIRKNMSLAAFRAEFMGRNHGVPCEFLAYEKPGWSYDDALSITLLHDVMVRPCGFASVPRIAPVWKVFDDFGATEAEWSPYWKNPVVVSPESVKASVYRRGGKSLIVVSNVSPDKPVSAVVALPDGASHAIDALAKRELEVVDGKVSLDIQPFRMVLIKAW